MRIGRLAQRSGIPVPTIKYYLRAGLLARGDSTAHNQADYGESHLRRLRVIDIMLGVGGLSVRGAATVLAAVDDVTLRPDDLLRELDAALPARHCRAVDAAARAAARHAITLVMPTEQVTEVYAAARLLDLSEVDAELSRYAAAAERSSACDVAVLRAYAKHHRLAWDGADVRIREALVLTVLIGGALQSATTNMIRHELLLRLLAEAPPADPP